MGTLYVVGTPIGNLEDISFRAVRVLKEVSLIAAEDTRRTGVLLKKYDISNKMDSYNDINKRQKTKHLLNVLSSGDVALVSDSGMPGISDPGYYLINNCIDKGINVVPVPGANAALSALVCSGLPTDKFVFYGFLSKKEKAKETVFKLLRDQQKTVIFYESPHRIQKTLKIMNDIFPDKKLCIGREITKKFEEFIRGTVSSVYDSCKDRSLKGELVLVLY